MIRAAIRNELLKTVHRLAFWVGFIFYAGVTLIEYANQYLRARNDAGYTFALPAAWEDILADDPEVIFVFGSMLLILLVANEFTWRTARQNVIDGLSKEQFFAGKLFLVPLLTVLFLGVRVVGGAAFAAPGRAGGPLVAGPHWSALAGVTVACVGSYALALFIALAVRSGGAAMGVWFLYFVVIENLASEGLVRLSQGSDQVVRFLPIHVFGSLTRYIQHDPAALQRAVERAVDNNRPPPEIWDPALLWLAGIGWVVVIVVAAFLWFRKRDL